jgi:antitoxin component of RelBE/YafQ-DinJ toxin-antitoxin module
MDKVALVSARVPVEIKRQGNSILEQIGSSPTQLVNTAYQYVIEHGELPLARQALKPAKRKLETTQLNKIKARSLLMALPGCEDLLDNKGIKEILAEGRQTSYESLT